ncbi:MAG TPA: aminoacetone oxidase family FAD-binding enzyme, partial [Dehalococcoidales bacterium]|nr:aminoacetone oxidase family FAD-binding enzyme [Dehalococcoidales bacterium]
VILAGGGKTYPAYGSDGSLFKVARQLGYTVIEPVPVAVPLIVKDKLCQSLQGQKISAAVRPVIEGKAGMEVEGELLFAQYGLSGTAILDVSESISLALNRDKKTDAAVQIDLVPFIKRGQLKEELAKRLKAGWKASEMLTGILPNRFSLALKNLFSEGDLTSAVSTLKGLQLKVSGTRGWNEAEFTSGGIDINQVNPATLESRIHGGVFFAGEILDVNGGRGGYNLAWAWASGLLAGRRSLPSSQP